MPFLAQLFRVCPDRVFQARGLDGIHADPAAAGPLPSGAARRTRPSSVAMSSEQRFIAAFSLILLILALWSFLLPPPAKQQIPVPIAERAEPLELARAPGEEVLDFQLGQARLAVGRSSGGIRDLTFDGQVLLQGAQPGWLEIRSPEGQPVPFSTRQKDGGLVSEATSAEGSLQWIRSIVPSNRLPGRLWEISVEASNRSGDAQKLSGQIVLYRTLHAASAEEQRFLSGLAREQEKQVDLRLKPGMQKRFDEIPSLVAAQGKSHTLVVKPLGNSGMFHVEHFPGQGEIGWIELAGEIAPGSSRQWRFELYVGPLEMDSLREAGMDQAVSFGAFSGITLVLLRFLNWSYGWLHNYGLAICFLSLAVWLPFSPITWYGMRMSTRTMEKMAAVRPQEERIRREHASNPSKMNQELLQLYRKHGVNPASGCVGCLPVLLTMPVYIALFQVLNRAPELRGAGFLWVKDLAAPDAVIRFPTALPLIGASFNLLPILATVATYYQQQLMQRQPTQLTEEQRIQQQIFKFFPLFLLIFFYQLPSGFMLYWVANSVFMVTQQLLILRLAKRHS